LCLIASTVLAAACSSSAPPGEPMTPTGGSGTGGGSGGGGRGGAGGGSVPSGTGGGAPDANPIAPAPDAAAAAADATAASTDASPPDLTAVADLAPGDATTTGPADMAPATPPLGEFPLAAVRMARSERLVAISAHIEGPTWRDGFLFFAHDGESALMRLSIADRRLVRYHPGLDPVGSLLLADGSLLVCDKQRAGKPEVVVQLFPDGKVGVLGDGSAPLCNDITVDAEGNIFFSDYRGAIFKITPDGKQSRALGVLANGVEVDPTGKYLYFNLGNSVQRAPIAPGGTLGSPQMVIGGDGDGCAFDMWGNYWFADFRAGQIVIVDTAKRQVLHRIGVAGGPTNLTFGGPNRDTLFVTADNSGIHQINVGARGFPGHPGAASYAIKRMLAPAPMP
jgi:sugar lactone lactonase YvrE